MDYKMRRKKKKKKVMIAMILDCEKKESEFI